MSISELKINISTKATNHMKIDVGPIAYVAMKTTATINGKNYVLVRQLSAFSDDFDVFDVTDTKQEHPLERIDEQRIRFFSNYTDINEDEGLYHFIEFEFLN
jgi:hypothetical protein